MAEPKTPPATPPPAAGDPPPGVDDQSTRGTPVKMPEGWTDPMEDIDRLAGKKEPAPPSGTPPGKPDDSPPSDKSKATPPATPPADDPNLNKKTDAPGDDDKDKDKPPATPPDGSDDLPPSKNFTRSKPLREAYDKTRIELQDLRKAYTDLEKQVQDGDVVSSLTTELDAARERIKGFEREQTLVDYQNSPEYKGKFVDPLNNLVDQASALMREVQIKTGENQSREGTKEDFLELVRMPLRQAAETATELFGPAAPTIMSLWQQVKTLHSQSKDAIKNAQENVDGILKKRTLEETERREFANRVFKAASEKIVNRFPEIFGDDPDDPEHGEMISKGRVEFDMAIHANPKVTDEQRITLLAGMRERAAALPAVLKRLHAATDRVEELEAELAKIKEQDPDAGGDPGATPPKKPSGNLTDDPEAPWNKRK